MDSSFGLVVEVGGCVVTGIARMVSGGGVGVDARSVPSAVQLARGSNGRDSAWSGCVMPPTRHSPQLESRRAWRWDGNAALVSRGATPITDVAELFELEPTITPPLQDSLF
jgi:hypothetical protein